jgi:hypothetical protein
VVGQVESRARAGAVARPGAGQRRPQACTASGRAARSVRRGCRSGRRPRSSAQPLAAVGVRRARRARSTRARCGGRPRAHAADSRPAKLRARIARLTRPPRGSGPRAGSRQPSCVLAMRTSSAAAGLEEGEVLDDDPVHPELGEGPRELGRGADLGVLQQGVERDVDARPVPVSPLDQAADVGERVARRAARPEGGRADVDRIGAVVERPEPAVEIPPGRQLDPGPAPACSSPLCFPEPRVAAPPGSDRGRSLRRGSRQAPPVVVLAEPDSSASSPDARGSPRAVPCTARSSPAALSPNHRTLRVP